MPTYVLDDGCVFNTIKNALELHLSPQDIVDYEEKISNISSLVRGEFKKSVYISDDYQCFKINENYIYEHLSHSDNPSYRDSFLLLFITLEKLDKFDSECHIDDGVYEKDEFFASSFIQNKYSGFITSRNLTDEDWWDNRLHHKLCTTEDVVQVEKSKFLIDGCNYQQFYDYKHLFWPECYFHNGTTNRFSNLSVSEQQYLAVLIRHLDFLDKDARSIFSLNPEPSRFIAEAASKGVDLSPESPNTHRNSSAMSERVIDIGHSPVSCEWHTKITPTTGRVHFNLNINELECLPSEVKNKLIVGIFAGHLTT